MQSYPQILDFNELDSKAKIDDLLTTLNHETEAYTQLLKLACIKNNLEATKYVYQKSVDKSIDIHAILLLAIKNYDGKILEYFIEQGVDTTFDNNKLIEKAISLINMVGDGNKNVIYLLLKKNKYSQKILKKIHDWSLQTYEFKVLKEVENQNPQLMKYWDNKKNVEKILKKLCTINFMPHHYDSDINVYDYALFLLNKGAQPQILENSLIVGQAFDNSQFEYIAQFILKNVDVKNILQGTMEFICDENWTKIDDVKKKIKDCQKYLDKNHIGLQCIPDWVK